MELEMIRGLTHLTAALLFCTTSAAHAQDARPAARPSGSAPQMPEGAMSATPLLRDYVEQRAFGELWARTGLSPRDRSLVTVAIVVAPRAGRMRCRSISTWR
jgi:4-carboxymuconolactone decarboxylase